MDHPVTKFVSSKVQITICMDLIIDMQCAAISFVTEQLKH